MPWARSEDTVTVEVAVEVKMRPKSADAAGATLVALGSLTATNVMEEEAEAREVEAAAAREEAERSANSAVSSAAPLRVTMYASRCPFVKGCSAEEEAARGARRSERSDSEISFADPNTEDFPKAAKKQGEDEVSVAEGVVAE